MVNTQASPVSYGNKEIAGRAIHYQKASKNILLTIFEGEHELLSKQALEYIEESIVK